MRYGFTTGSCAAAAAKAAAYMLLTGKIKNCITIETPKGIPHTAEVTDIVRGESQVSCAVVKDGGDDPDVTSGSKICATVTADNRGDGEKELLQIDGGKGVACDETRTGSARRQCRNQSCAAGNDHPGSAGSVPDL